VRYSHARPSIEKRPENSHKDSEKRLFVEKRTRAYRINGEKNSMFFTKSSSSIMNNKKYAT